MSLKYFPEPMTLAPWLEKIETSPAPPWFIKDWIPVTGIVFVAGRAKWSKKSWLTLTLAMMIAEGKGRGGLVVERRAKVLYFAREGIPFFDANRVRRLERGMGFDIKAISDNLYYATGGQVYLDNPEHIEYIARFCTERGIELVVFDTFAKSFRGDENSAQEAGRAMNGAELLRDYGLGTLLVHHVRKAPVDKLGGGIDIDGALRGSSSLAGAYDVMISLMALEVAEEHGWWAVVGGKILEAHACPIAWEIPKASDSARLILGARIGKDELDEMLAPPPNQDAKFSSRE